jgi:hypothetical protein
LNAKTHSMAMMPDFTFKVKPITVRKQDTKCHDLAGHYLAHGIKITTTLREIGDASCMSLLAAIPNSIQMNA